jgi:hypothetical protein
MFGDPGPCPVDDCPHHTCVGPSPDISLVVMPARDGASTPRSAYTIPANAPAGTFTSGTYRRAAHHPANRREP